MASEKMFCQKVLSILQKELECAESFQETSEEVQTLIKAEKFHQVSGKLMDRDEVIQSLISLDQHLLNMFSSHQVQSDNAEWIEIFRMARNLSDEMASIIGMDYTNHQSLKERCCDISQKLTTLNGVQNAMYQTEELKPIENNQYQN